jgi:LCP family protein required for cell wall assembly
MLMGIGWEGEAVAKERNFGGAMDMAALMIFDPVTEKCNILSLNRDMMVHMPVINEKGKERGSFFGQLGYSHTFGTGMEDSCENARKTVSNLLYGLEIDHYFALNMDAIGILNDAVGGVTVNITDDFSPVDPTMVKGLYTLRGEQARAFVQSRMIIGDGLNLSRMRRQEEYMRGFVSALMEKLEADDSVILQAYEDIADYTVTDCSAAVLSRLAKDFEGYTLGEMYSIKGENREGEVYMEFYHDEEALDALILELFYAPKK